MHRPPLVQLGDNFKAQNAVFGQVQVAHQQTLSVRREHARKDVDETEHGARRAVQNVANFVLEVLDRHGDLAEVETVRRPADTGNLRVG